MATLDVRPGLNASKVVNHVHTEEQEIARLQHLYDWLTEQAEDIYREMDRKRQQLAAFIDKTHEPSGGEAS